MSATRRVLQLQVLLVIVMMLGVFSWNSALAQIDQTPPSVSITDPRNNDNLQGTATITVMASDPDDLVAFVELFYQQGVLVNEISPPKVKTPYTWNWNTSTVDNGTYQLFAKASDTNGNNANSTPITVHIQNGAATGTPAFSPGSLGILAIILAIAAIGVMVLYRRRSLRSLKPPRASAT